MKIKRLWYELNDRGRPLPLGMTLGQFLIGALGLIVLIVLQDMLVFVLVGYGMICLGVGIYCWFLEWQFKRQGNDQSKNQPTIKWLL